jgi:hypothetical protein
LVQDPLGSIRKLGVKGTLWGGGTILEPVALITSIGDELVLGGSLRNVESVAVKIVLELRLSPGVKDRVLCGVGLLCEV